MSSPRKNLDTLEDEALEIAEQYVIQIEALESIVYRLESQIVEVFTERSLIKSYIEELRHAQRYMSESSQIVSIFEIKNIKEEIALGNEAIKKYNQQMKDLKNIQLDNQKALKRLERSLESHIIKSQKGKILDYEEYKKRNNR